jgi:hypothetical protein
MSASRNSLNDEYEDEDEDVDSLFDESPHELSDLPVPLSAPSPSRAPDPDHSTGSDTSYAASSYSSLSSLPDSQNTTTTLNVIHPLSAEPIVKLDYDTHLAIPAATSQSLALKPVHTGINGLYFYPELLLDPALAQRTFSRCMDTFFHLPNVNQVMLFGRTDSPVTTLLPDFLQELLDVVCSLLQPVLPSNVHDLLFCPPAPRSRQAIINLYHPGEGISPHVDLLTRYDDGIVGVSLGSGCAMHFSLAHPSIPTGSDDHSATENLHKEIYLPVGSFIVLSGDARYLWKHGIDAVPVDLVPMSDGEEEWIERQTRISVTFRWLLPGADIVGSS